MEAADGTLDGIARPRLSEAVAGAIAQGSKTIDGMEAGLREALTTIEAAVTRSHEALGTRRAAVALIDAVEKQLDKAKRQAADLFARQRNALGTVNFALFGRTGAGKSSLLEAFLRGDGGSISPGQSDHTTEVRSETWHGCRFIDTPGTNGWSQRRDLLETRARVAVETADVVLLCFDNQNQQVGEFEKVGAWVREYGKPVIAVLNVRNQHWRRTRSVATARKRRDLSQGVRDHAGNIEAELASLGIAGAPVVAISAQRAAFARARGDYAGPSAKACAILLKEVGADRLAAESNFHILEEVLVTALVDHADALRLGMLRAQMRKLLGDLLLSVRECAKAAVIQAGVEDRLVDSLFAVIGYPAEGSAGREALREGGEGHDLLSLAEHSRGGAYDARSHGRLARFARQRTIAEIGLLRARSLADAEEAIASTFERGKDLPAEEFAARVYSSDKVLAACERVASEAADMLRCETGLLVEDARIDLEAIGSIGRSIAGGAGGWRRKGGYAVAGTGVALGGLSTVLGAMAVTSSATIVGLPASLALGVASFLTGAAGMVAGWFGGSQRRKAEEAKQRAWSEAIATARRSVNETYDGFADRIAEAVSSLVLESSGQVLSDVLSRTCALWTLARECERTGVELERLVEAVPVVEDPQWAIGEAADDVAAKLHLPSRLGALLGEDWITDPEGLSDERDGLGERVARPAVHDALVPPLAELQEFGDLVASSVVAGAGAAWLLETERCLADDPEAARSLGELAEIARRRRYRLQLFGDYSAGKTSFAKRLLVEAGLPVPPTAEVRANPTTASTHLYELGPIDLVDAPGLQSTNEEHGSSALRACPDASMVLLLLQPNLLVGDTAQLELLLRGDRARGLAPKLQRTVFVVHRSDELGADPRLAPDEYAKRCERKSLELRRALLSRGLEIGSNPVLFMSADPYQLVGDDRDVRPVDYDRFRSWDGFAGFREAIAGMAERHPSGGADISVLEGGLARLGSLDAEALRRLDELTSRRQTLECLGRLLDEVVREGGRLGAEQRAELERLVEDEASARLEAVAGAVGEAELAEAARRLATWGGDPAFADEVARWQAAAAAATDDWFRRSADVLGRAMRAPRFASAALAGGRSFDASLLMNKKGGWSGRLARLVAQPLKGATPKIVYQAGKAMKVVFRPWGAVKLARTLGRVGVVTGVVASVLEVADLYGSWKSEKRRRAFRQSLRGEVRRSAQEILKTLVEGTNGPIFYLNAIELQFRTALDDLRADQVALASEVTMIEARRARYAARAAAAWAALESTDQGSAAIGAS